MAHLTTAQLRDAATMHAERAHQLLAEAETAYANGGPNVGQREGLRIELAEAHAACSTALSSLTLPLMAVPG